MIKFLSPVTIEENFLVKNSSVQQKFYIDNIDDNLFNVLIITFYKYMQSIPDEGLKYYIHKSEMFYNKINYISINPIMLNNKLYCQTNVYTLQGLSNIEKGILKDYLEDIFAQQINTYMIVNDIEYDFNNEYYNNIKNTLKEQNLKYTIRLNFYDYNTFSLKEREDCDI